MSKVIQPDNIMSAPPNVFVACYVSAKLIHAHALVDLRKNWPKVYFTARWPLTANLSSEQAKPARLWVQDNVDDITRAECFLGYAEPDDELHSVLWECAIAWAHGKDLYLVGDRKQYGKYVNAERVQLFSTIEAALTAISKRKDYSPSDRFDRMYSRMNENHAELRDMLKPAEVINNAVNE